MPREDAERREGVPLTPGVVHIWRLSLLSERLSTLEAHLSADERNRAARYRDRVHRDRFVAARGQLREILGRVLDIAPSDVAFAYSSHGKPFVVDAPDVSFNLSDAADRALVAVTHTRRVGVDLEAVRAVPDADAIVDRFFSPREVSVYRALPDAVRSLAFITCWTRKEAFVKAVGEGLSHPLDAFDVTVRPDEPAALLALRGGDAARWHLHTIDAGLGYVATLAVEGETTDIRLWHRL